MDRVVRLLSPTEKTPGYFSPARHLFKTLDDLFRANKYTIRRGTNGRVRAAKIYP
jgi:hypothetical protein